MISEKEIQKSYNESLEIFPARIEVLKGKKEIHCPNGRSWKETITLADAIDWLQAFKHRENALCLKTGKVSAVTVIDDDTRDGVHPNLKGLISAGIICAQSGNNGHHFFFQCVPEITTASYKTQKIDIRNDGGLIILPPSFIEGHRYQWITPFSRDTLKPMSEALKLFVLSLQRPVDSQERTQGTKSYDQLSAPQKKYLDAYLLRCSRARKGVHDRSACDFALCVWAVKIELSPIALWNMVYNISKFSEPAHGRAYFNRTYQNALRSA